MKKHTMSWIGCLACVATIAVPHLAAQRQPVESGVPTKVTVIGCLKPSGSAPNADVMVTDYRGGPAPTFKVTGEAEQLRVNMNQTVEIVGSLVPGSTGSRLRLK